MIGLIALSSIVFNGPVTVISIGLAISILWWLRADMKRQREWRDAKEQKIARLERKIAQKKAKASETNRPEGE